MPRAPKGDFPLSPAKMADREEPLCNVEDEAWTDRLDKHTGAVFYVSPVDSPEQTSGRPRSSHRRSLSVGDLAAYSTSSPRHSTDGQLPAAEGVNLSTQSRGARKHILGRMYGSLKKKAARSSSQERQSHYETMSHTINSSNLSGSYEGPRLKSAIPPSLGLQTQAVHPRTRAEGVSATLMQFVKGQATESRYEWRQYGHLYHAVLYVTLDVEEGDSDGSKDMLFQCPKVIGCQLSHLLKLRGVFITLNDVMKQIAGTSSSISTVCIQDQLVHVGCAQYGPEALLVAMAADCVSCQEVQQVVEETEQLLTFMYGSVQRAFFSTENHPALHQMFMLMFERLLGSTPINEGPSLNHTLSASPAMMVSQKLQAVLERELNSFEVLVSESLSLSSLGGVKPAASALFYKGCVVMSRLTREDLGGVTLFLRANCLLYLTSMQWVHQTVIWREMASEAHKNDTQTTISRGRKFLLVVGQKNGLLCIVCHSQHTPKVAVSPDPMIVHKGRTLLLSLEAKGVFSACERSNSENTPHVCSLDDRLAVARHRGWGKRPSFHNRSNSGGGAESDDAATRKGRGGARSASSSPKQSRLRSGNQPPNSGHQLKGVLLHYISINSLTGAVITPCSHPGQGGLASPWNVGGPLHREMVMQFSRTCLAIRQTLHHPQQGVREQGVLYECSSRGHTEKGKLVEMTGSYWIIGRRFVKEDREVYVCVADSVPPELAELAFLLQL